MKTLLMATFGLLALGIPSFADTVETEPNDSFATAQVLGSGELVAIGNLGGTGVVFGDTLASVSGTLAEDGVNGSLSFSFGTADGLTANTIYEVLQLGDGVDTRLGQFDSAGTGGNLLQDVDAFFANELFNASTDANGDLFISVAAFENGAYDPAFVGGGDVGAITVDVTEILAPALENLTADFFTFTGLVAGNEYTATTAALGGTTPDTILALYDAAGAQIGFNDDIDGANNRRSELTFVADGTGTATLAVSGWNDAGTAGEFSGGYDAADGGDYSLSLVAAVPEPVATTLICFMGLAGLARRRRA